MKSTALALPPWLLSGLVLVLSLSMAIGAGLDFAGRWAALAHSGPVPAWAGSFWQLAPLVVIAVGVPAAWLALATNDRSLVRTAPAASTMGRSRAPRSPCSDCSRSARCSDRWA